jgi:hypothetical protein
MSCDAWFVPSDPIYRCDIIGSMKRAVWIIVLCIPAIACGQDRQAIRASKAACGQGQGQIKTGVLTGLQSPTQIAPDKSLVYFVNPAKWFYFKVSIGADGHRIAELTAKSYFAIAMQPGKHHFCARLERWQQGGPYVGLLDVDLQPAHTYYIRAWATSDDNPFDGGSSSGAYVVPQLETVNADEGKFLVDATQASLAQNPAAMKADMKGCGPASEQFNTPRFGTAPTPPNPPSPGGAAVYFIDLISGPVRVGLDGKWAGALKWNSYAELEIAPGVHHLCERRQGRHKPFGSVALYALNATVGDSYYFLVGSGGNGFDEINPDEARLLIATSKFGLNSQKLFPTTSRSRAATGAAQKPVADNAAQQAAMKACGPPHEHFKVDLEAAVTRSSPPNPGKATIYFAAMSTGGLWPSPTVRVAADGRWIGALKQNSYTKLEVAPGEYHFCVRTPGPFRLAPASLYGLNAKTGHSYYFVVDDQSSDEYQPVGTISLNRIDSDEGRLLVAQARRATSSPKLGRHPH